MKCSGMPTTEKEVRDSQRRAIEECAAVLDSPDASEREKTEAMYFRDAHVFGIAEYFNRNRSRWIADD